MLTGEERVQTLREDAPGVDGIEQGQGRVQLATVRMAKDRDRIAVAALQDQTGALAQPRAQDRMGKKAAASSRDMIAKWCDVGVWPRST